MDPQIELTFHRLRYDPSVESAVQRRLAQLSSLGFETDVASVFIEPLRRRQVQVRVALKLTNGVSVMASGIHVDAHVAVIDAFRRAQSKLVDRSDVALAMAS